MTTKKYYKPQTTLPNAKVIRKIGKWTIEQYHNPRTGKWSHAITDGFTVDYPILYPSGEVAFDDPYSIPNGVKEWFRNYAQKIPF